MLAMLLFLAQAASPPTLAEVERLSPAEAGKLVLQGKEPGPVVSAGRKVERYIGIPGITEYELIEEPRAIPGGCVRRRWIAKFGNPPRMETETAPFRDATAIEEVALPASSGCAAASYSRMNIGVNVKQALEALAWLRGVADGTIPAEFACRDEIDSGLCASPEATRAGLRAANAWMVSGTMALWLGTPGEAVTIVRFPGERPDQVSVTRRIPAPF